MAVYADRVRETTNTSGLGAYSLNGAVGGFRTFSSAVPSGSTVVYCVEDGTSFEVGEGTLTVGTPNTISRTTVLSSSNNNQLVSWGAGTKNIFLTAASARMVITDRANTLTGSLSLPANGLAVGTNQLVTSGGNVGIGTSSPGAALDIANGPLARITNDSATLRLRSSSTNANYGELAIDSSGTTYLSSQTGNLFLSSQAASGQVLFRSGGGVERMRLDASGNVGVGTTSPAARLHLSTSTAADTVIRLDRNSTERASLSAVFDGLQLNGAQVVRFATGNTERARLDTSGNLGIGTASPTAILHTKTAGGEGLRIQGTASSAIIRFTDAADASTGFIGQNTTFDIYNQNSTAMRFGTGNTERMRIDNVGNVGIGSTNPSSKLEVSNGVNSNGALKVSGTATTAGNFASMNFVTGTAPWTVGTEAGNGRFFIYNNAAAMDQIGFGGGTNSSVTLTAAGSTAAFVVNTNGAERMRIDAGGQLGLGTNSPGYRLDVDHAGGVARFRNGTTGYGSIALGASATASQNFQLSSDGSGNLIVYRGIPGSGTEQVRVDTAGNLGVGGTATNYTGSGYDSIAVNGSTGGVLEFQSAGTQAARITGWSNTLAVHTNNVERLRVDSSGNLALGASLTTARLLVQGSGAQETVVVQHGGTNHSIINLNQSDALGINPSFRPILSLRKGGTTSFNLSVDGSTQGLTYFEAYSATAALVFVTNSVERARIDSSGNVLITGNGGLGYGAGSGGTVTQATSKTTGVTLNKPNGSITLNAAALAAGATVSFTLTSSSISATDVVHVQRISGGTAGVYHVWCDSVAAGSCVICVRNIGASSLSEAVVLQFVVHKSVAT